MKRTRKKPKTVGVIGYGSQGRAVALNLRDSGYDVIVGLRPRSRSKRAAIKDGFSVESIPSTVNNSNIVAFAFPDHCHRQAYREYIRENLSRGSLLLFLHGLSIHFGLVVPPADCDVVMIAPHGPGNAVREKFLTDRTLSAFLAVHQDTTGHAEKIGLQLARGIGIAKKRLVTTTFEHEAIGDLFGEQAVLCGGLAALIKNGFEVLVDKGIPPENAYLEVVYQLDLIIDLIKQHGIEGMFNRISVAAQYGSVKSGPTIIDKSTRKKMEKVADRIVSGKFVRELDSLTPADIRELGKSVRKLTNPKLEKAARKFTE